MIVGKHLDLDVPRRFEKLLHVDRLVAEPGSCLGLGNGNGIGQRGLRMDDAHAAPATTGRRLDDDRVADLAGHPEVLFGAVSKRPVEPGTVGTPADFIALMAATLSPI